jgi:uncharacterized tellurite resistance protein B-like protein
VIQTIREFFAVRIASEERPEPSLELATAALLIEVSRSDFDASDEERAAIEERVREAFGLTEEETREIIALAEEEVARAVSIYEFTRLVDKGFTPEQKRHVVGLLWEVAVSDERIEAREEHLIRKVATLLHVPHEAYIAEKIAARERRKS